MLILNVNVSQSVSYIHSCLQRILMNQWKWAPTTLVKHQWSLNLQSNQAKAANLNPWLGRRVKYHWLHAFWVVKGWSTPITPSKFKPRVSGSWTDSQAWFGRRFKNHLLPTTSLGFETVRQALIDMLEQTESTSHTETQIVLIGVLPEVRLL